MDEYDINDFEEPNPSTNGQNSPTLNRSTKTFVKPFSMNHFNKGSMKIINNVLKKKGITNNSRKSKFLSSESNLSNKTLIKQMNQSKAETIIKNNIFSQGINFISETLLSEG